MQRVKNEIGEYLFCFKSSHVRKLTQDAILTMTPQLKFSLKYPLYKAVSIPWLVNRKYVYLYMHIYWNANRHFHIIVIEDNTWLARVNTVWPPFMCLVHWCPIKENFRPIHSHIPLHSFTFSGVQWSHSSRSICDVNHNKMFINLHCIMINHWLILTHNCIPIAVHSDHSSLFF